MNFSTGQNGESRNVVPRRQFATWVLNTIKDKLRPQTLILVGLKGFLQTNREIKATFESVFNGVNLTNPDRVLPLRSYTEKALTFSAWRSTTKNGAPLNIIMWPQHPSRAPFTNENQWKASCAEFARYSADTLA
jgi:hypothetical protein